jgi:hypothetical protein
VGKRALPRDENAELAAYFDDATAPPAPRGLDDDGWPHAVPVLTPDDMSWKWTGPGNACSLFEWVWRAFDPDDVPIGVWDEACACLEGVIAEWSGRRFNLYLFSERSEVMNRPSLAWQAACWNEAMHRLGYDIPVRKRKCPKNES